MKRTFFFSTLQSISNKRTFIPGITRKIESGEPLPEPYLRANRGGFAVGEHIKERTDKFYVKIEKVAGEIEKGSKGGLRTRKGIQDAVDAIQEGKSVDKSLKHTNFNFFVYSDILFIHIRDALYSILLLLLCILFLLSLFYSDHQQIH